MDCVGTPVRIGAGTIAPRIAPPHAVAPWSVGVAARDANASGVEHTTPPMKKSLSDEKLDEADLQEARAQFHDMLKREQPHLSNHDRSRIVRSTVNKKTADHLEAAIQQKMATLEGQRQIRPFVVHAALNTGCSSSNARIAHVAQPQYVQAYLMGDDDRALKEMCAYLQIEERTLRQKQLRVSDLVALFDMLEAEYTSLSDRIKEFSADDDIVSSTVCAVLSMCNLCYYFTLLNNFTL